MAKFTYKVIVEVPDEGLILGGDWDEDGKVYSPDEMAAIVMRERLGCDEWYGFDYTVNYEVLS